MTSGQTTPSAPAQPKTSGLAIASLVLGIAGLCTVGLGSIAGVILGIAALVRIGRSGGQLAGRGLAIGGIIASIVTLLVWVVAAAAIFLVSSRVAQEWDAASGKVQHTMTQSRIHALCQMTLAYMADNQDRFPPPDTWPQALKDAKFLSIDDTMLADSRDPQAGRAVAMNALLAGKKADDVRRPNETVLYFECAAGTPPAGGRQNLPPEPRDRAGYIIAFCDGRVDTVAKGNLGRLIWNPADERPNE